MVEFVYEDPKQGGVKDVYFSPDRSYVVAFYRKQLDTAGRERIEEIVGNYRQRIFEQAGGEYWKNIFCWPDKIVEYNGKLGVVMPTYDKAFFFSSGILAGAEKEGKWFASAKNFNKFIPPKERGALNNYIRICLTLSRGVRRLHAAGLAHSDLSYKNCLVDPSSGRACIIDVDGLVVPGRFPPDVLGTPDFIAPEVVQSYGTENPKTPCRETDLHALATLIYFYLLHRNPLDGSKVWSQDDQEQRKLETGEKALFIEHPTDPTNRLIPSPDEAELMPWRDPVKLPYTTTGPYLSELIERAFVDGLHNPSMRPIAGEWEDALIKTSDLLLPCANPKCVKKFFVYNNQMNPVCPYCGTAYTLPVAVLDLYYSPRGSQYISEKRRIVVWSGQSLYKWHVDRSVTPNERISPEDCKRVGYFQYHKNQWFLVNQTSTDMWNVSTNQQIQPGQAVALTNGLKILLSKKPTGRLVNVMITK